MPNAKNGLINARISNFSENLPSSRSACTDYVTFLLPDVCTHFLSYCASLIFAAVVFINEMFYTYIIRPNNFPFLFPCMDNRFRKMKMEQLLNRH